MPGQHHYYRVMSPEKTAVFQFHLSIENVVMKIYTPMKKCYIGVPIHEKVRFIMRGGYYCRSAGLQ